MFVLVVASIENRVNVSTCVKLDVSSEDDEMHVYSTCI